MPALHHNILAPIITSAILALIPGIAAAGVEYKDVKLPVCPVKIPKDWLAPSSHPRLFCTPDELLHAKQTVIQTERGKTYLARQREICSRFIGMDESRLRDLVPKPGSLFVYGAGMNLDPVHKKRLLWCGWDNPFSVKDSEGRVFPNSEWKDDGSGSVDPTTGERYYFVAQGNAFITKELEQRVLPALADLYALEGNRDAAKAAAILLDQIAVVYPTNRRGPIDYPLDYPDDPKEPDRAGRLDRPYYQTARGLMNYVNTIDLLASSGEFERPSVAGGQSIREHIIRNLLWDGSCYCYDYAVREYQLYNGHADYLRGAAVTGILLNTPEFCEPLFHGVSGMPAMLDNNYDRSGLYYETSPLYAEHTRELFISMADIFEAARSNGWKDVQSIYANPAMRMFLTETFDRQEVGGHVPVLGDDGPDPFVNDPMRRYPTGKFVLSDNYINGQILGAWVRLVRSPDRGDRVSAAKLLADTFGGNAPIVPPNDRWSIYHIGADALQLVENQKADPERFETGSVFYGGKGLAILRGGRGSKRYGAQLFFGPLHNHGQEEFLTWSFYDKGAEWSFDPGYYQSHYRFGWTAQTVAHQAVTVDAASVNSEQGSGHLISWFASPDVQWAMADHPGAYRERGVTTYERLIAQVGDPATGGLGYWLDVSRVAGGKLRDDSFHTQMTDLKLNIQLPEPSKGSIFGPIDYGRIVLDDGRLEGYPDKGFYWYPDGAGYGFLGNPRTAEMSSDLRAVLTNPGYAGKLNAAIVADLCASPGRQVIVADGPQTLNSPSVPYILRRDFGDGLSVFAKIVRVVDSPETDQISSFVEIPVVSAPETKAWCVTWTDGRRDLWIVGDGTRKCEVTAANLPKVITDARVALVRFDSQGKAVAVSATETSAVSVSGGPLVSSTRFASGTVEAVGPDESPVKLKVSWDAGNAKLVYKGLPFITIPSTGQPVVWELDSAADRVVNLADIKSVMAATDFEPVPGKPGWYNMLTAVSRFYATTGRSNRAYAIGKPVFSGSKYIGRIADIADDVHSVRIESNGKPVETRKTFRGRILETGPGDRFRVPITVNWRSN